MLHHKVIHLVYRTGGAVFNRKNSVLAQTLFNSGKNSIEILEVHDPGKIKESLARDLGECTLYALASDQARSGNSLGVFSMASRIFFSSSPVAASERDW